MPTYQYVCTDCGDALEVQQRFTDDSLTVCPECEGRLRKVFNAVGVVFKGSGFYRTDSRAADQAANGTKSSKDSSESQGSESPKNSESSGSDSGRSEKSAGSNDSSSHSTGSGSSTSTTSSKSESAA